MHVGKTRVQRREPARTCICDSLADVGYRIYAPFPECKMVVSLRRCRFCFHSAIWCRAKDSIVTDCVLKCLHDQNLHRPEEFQFLCVCVRMWKKRRWGRAPCGDVCSAEGPQRTSTGGEHTLARDRSVKHWLTGGRNYKCCLRVAVCSRLSAARAAGEAKRIGNNTCRQAVTQVKTCRRTKTRPALSRHYPFLFLNK